MRWLYSLIWYLAAPLIALWWLKRALREPEWRHGLRERFGYLRDYRSDGIWLHAASVGEVQAVMPLLHALQERWPEMPVSITAFTPTGKAHAQRLAPEDVRCALLPFDLPGATARFIARLRPRLAIIVETELWPNLYAACRKQEVPLLLVSARVTERGAKQYASWRSLVADTLSVPAVIGVQTDADADRLEGLGASPLRISVTGNIKFDFALPEGFRERARALAGELGMADRTVWIAASTHPGEDEQVLAAHERVLADYPGALLLLAPRHPGRGDALAGMLDAAGWEYGRRGSGSRCRPGMQVYLLDSLGELALCYGICEVAFIGGSLVDIGGHNLLEPAAFGLPLICGPHVQNISGMHALLQDAGALVTVRDGGMLGDVVAGLLADPERRRSQGKAALDVLERNRGSVERVLRLAEGMVQN